MKKQFHIIYKTTCTKTKRFYVGMHSTDDLDDGYLGSGKLLSKSIKKHGKDLHVREVIKIEKNREDLSIAEREIVNEQLLKNKRCMNLIIGGEGGMYGQANPFFGRKHSEKTKRLISETGKGRIPSLRARQMLSERFKNVPLKKEHKEKLKLANIGKTQNHSAETVSKRETAKCRQITIDGQAFQSITIAAKCLNTNRHKIYAMLRAQDQIKE